MFPLGVDAAAHVVHDRRPVARPALLVPAHQLETNRSAGQLRHQRGRLGDVEVVVAVAEGARALVVDDADLVRLRQPERRWTSTAVLEMFCVLL